LEQRPIEPAMDERGPDDELRLQLEAVSRFDTGR
jgi:hypothetical protein